MARYPTPAKILRARGSWRAKLRENEATLPVKAPPAPAWLSAEAKREWKLQVKQLEAMGLIAEADRALLAFYCQAWGEFVEADGRIKKEGLTLRTKEKYTYPNPLVGIRNGAFERAQKIAAQFGFSPAARARLKSHGQNDPAPGSKDRFFDGA